MGAWGHLNFENDTALDFVWELEEKGINWIKNAFEVINGREEDSFLDSDLCAEALAGIEFIAAAKGNPAADFPEDAEEWLQKNKAGLLANYHWIAKSKQAIDRIQHNSELKDLWEETNEFEEWTKVLEDLSKRISS
jgi:hypothetical protein